MQRFLRRYFLWIALFAFLVILVSINCTRFWAKYKLHKISAEYLQWYKLHFPVEASKKGIFDEQGNLPDFSPDSLRVLQQQLANFSEKLEKINSQKLSDNDKVAYAVLKGEIDRKYFSFFLWKKWKKNADFYARKLQDAVYFPSFALTDSTRDYAIPIINRLKKFPVFMQQMKSNLEKISPEDREIALQRCMNLEKWLSFDLRAKLRNYFEQADTSAMLIDVVNESLLVLINFLERDVQIQEQSLTPFSSKEYLRLCELYLGEKISPDSISSELSLFLQKIKREMYFLAKEYYFIENKDIQTTDTLKLIRFFDSDLKKKMLRRDQIEKFIKNLDGYTRRFLHDIAGLNVNVDFPLSFEWEIFRGENPHDLVWRETFFASEHSPVFKCRLTAINANRDLIEQLSILSRYNKPEFRRIYLTDVLPIHIFQWHSLLKKKMRVVRFFPNPQLTRSWPYFFAEFLIARGYAGYDRGLKFFFLKKLASLAMCSLIEINLYFKNWNENDVRQFITENRHFFVGSLAALKFQLYNNPGKNLMIFRGYERLGAVKKIYLSKEQRKSHPAEFYKAVLEQGPVPISFIEKIMGE